MPSGPYDKITIIGVTSVLLLERLGRILANKAILPFFPS